MQNPTIGEDIKEHHVSQARHDGDYIPKMEPNSSYTEQPLDGCYGGTAHTDMLDNSHLSRNVTHQQRTSQQTQLGEDQGVSDLVRFLARRKLVSTGLIQFNDRPECYRAWRASFLNVIKGLNLSASEQLDLLLK